MDAVNTKALEDLKKYRADGCHMLVPCMDQIADVAGGFRLIVTAVQLRPHPRDKDVYPHEGGHFDSRAGEWKETKTAAAELVRISGQGLEKLAQHTALVWNKPHVTIDNEHPERQLCEVSGAVRMPDGYSFYRLSDLYGMDLAIVEEQLRAMYPEQNKKWLLDRDLLQKKVNQTKLCVSGARNRVIRKILGVDGTYTVGSLEKPFIAVRVIPWLDMTDEYTRRLVTEMNVKQMAITNLFGGQMPEQRQIAHDDAPAITYGGIPAEACNGDVVDAEDDTKHYQLENKSDEPDSPPFSMEPEPGQDKGKSASLRADFEACDVEGQCKALVVMAGTAKFALNGWLKKFDPPMTVQKLSTAKRLEVYDYLAAEIAKKGEG
ncbi:MAG: hypothetical protein ABIK28_16125 [Planctomycetota bacterium]